VIVAEKARDYEAELRRVMNALADSIVDASDEEIVAEMRDEGLDPEAEAAKVRELLLAAAKKEKRRQAQLRYEAETARLRARDYRLPATAFEQRALLASFLAARPSMRSQLTAQFRDLNELSDSDIENSLKKLDDLGALAEFLRSRDKE
jgi:hypothetical protein